MLFGNVFTSASVAVKPTWQKAAHWAGLQHWLPGQDQRQSLTIKCPSPMGTQDAPLSQKRGNNRIPNKTKNPRFL